MKPDEWKQLKYFTPHEKWGDPAKMNPELVFGLDLLRKYVGRKIFIHCGYEQRAAGGWHPEGRAVDLHIEGLHPIEQYLAATRFNTFSGFGVYLWWNNPGLHLDNRPLGAIDYRALWGSVEPKKYLPLNREFIKAAMAIA